jgi:predicted nuclease with TOPRIM domain
MEATYKPIIKETFKKVRNLSFEEKKEALYDEKKINQLLDAIIEFKKTLSVKTSKIENLTENIEQITWFNDLDNESLMLINDLVSSIRDLHSSLARQYVSFNNIRLKGIAKEEIKNFKSAIDDLKDVANDLDSRFFFLPNNDVFQQTSKELSLL